jgi:hypothetical protein
LKEEDFTTEDTEEKPETRIIELVAVVPPLRGATRRKSAGRKDRAAPVGMTVLDCI